MAKAGWWELSGTKIVLNRTGLVRANEKGVADDQGSFLGVGASYFPAISLERTDSARLDANLAVLAEHSDFVRIFGDVGGGVWADRETHADWPDYWPIVQELFTRLQRFGLRAEVTIFAGSPVFHSYADRLPFVLQWANFINAHPDQVWAAEVCNEGIGAGSAQDIYTLAQVLNSHVWNLIASTNAAWGDPDGCSAAYDYMPLHAPRGPWPSYVRQLWGISCQALIANDEGKGLQSSVSEDSDPVHQTAHAVVSWLAGEAWFTLHSGAGTYAQATPLPPPGVLGVRQANLWEQPGFQATLDAIAALRIILPPDLPNWRPVNGNDYTQGSPVGGVYGPLEGRIYCATNNAGRWVCCAFGRDVLSMNVTARVPFALRDILTGSVLQTVQPGQRIPFGPADAYLLTSPA